MDFESLSDAELRTKILEYGFPVGPVTHTTRNILIKKLKNLEESRGGAGSRHSLAARYSSDDTDDDTLANTKKKKKAVNTRRQTLANPMPPPASAPISSNVPKSPSRKRVSRNFNVDSEATEYNNVKLNSNRTPTKDKTFVKSNKSLNDNDGLETGSDSDVVEESPQPVIVPKFGGGTSKVYNDRTSLDVNSPKSYETNWRRTIQNSLDANLRASTTPKNERYSVNLPKTGTILDSIRNDSSVSRDNSKKDDILGNYETPFLSAFTRNLSTMKSKNSPAVSGAKYRFSASTSTPEVKESDSNGHYNSPLRSKYPSGLSTPYVTSSLDKTRDINRYKSSAVSREEIKNNQNFISMILLGVLALFFIGIAIVYLGLEGKTDNSPMLPTTGSDIPVCNPGLFDRNSPGVNCVLQKNLEATISLIKELYSVLMKRSISHECDGAKEPSHITNKELINLYSSHEMPDSISETKEILQMAHLLLFKNPEWGMSLVEIDDDEPQLLEIMENVILARLAGKLGIVLREPHLPWTCYLKKRVQYIVSSLLIVAFGKFLTDVIFSSLSNVY